MRRWFSFAGVLVAVIGCGDGYRIAAVSGTVTMNDKPLTNSYVHFAPLGGKDFEPGPTAQGKTDSQGKYILQLNYPPKPGAVVGPSRVYITTATESLAGKEQADAGGPRTRERIPARYNVESTLTFDVPRDGTDRADFKLTSP